MIEWPEFKITEITYPYDLLREQLKTLYRASKSRLKGKVELRAIEGERVKMTAYVNSSRYDSFRYNLFYVEAPLAGWPCEFYAPTLKPGFVVRNNKEFMETLKVVLQSRTIVVTLTHLLSMSEPA